MRALGLVVLLVLLAHSIPLSSLALELPVTEEPAAEPEETSEPIPEEFLVPEEPIEEPVTEVQETEIVEVPAEEALVAPVFMMESASFEPTVSGTIIAKSPSWAWDPSTWSGLRYGINLDLFHAPNLLQEGTFTHAIMPLKFFGGGHERFSFSMRDPYGVHTGCITSEKTALEWGLVPDEYRTVIIGPFPEGCDTTRHPYLYANGEGSGRVSLPGGTVDGLFAYPYIFYIQDPEPQICEECASNVLFIPGIKGSRLYVDNGEEEKLWDPLGNDDIRALFLSEEGGSLNRVYAKDSDVLGTVAGFVDIYEGFLNTLASLANNGEINNWEAVAYDWRLSLEDIVTTGVEEDGRIYYGEATSTPYIEQTLRSLAASSKTGKVTIVAHSNGGLVTKALLSRLGDVETSALVDNVIFVGVPQSGAPQALGALLFGYKEGLPWWFPFMVSPAVAREMAENSPMGYHLLPTQNYFDSIALDPTHTVAQFNAHALYAPERSSYGSAIDSADELSSYLLAREGGRMKPLAERYSDANVLNENLIDYALNTHQQIDGWRPPADVQLYQIAGWGEDTISGVEFYEECVSSGCKAKYRPTFIEDGDGVVPIPSALMIEEAQNVERYWVDLRDFGFGSIGNRDHGNILELTGLQLYISSIIDKGALQIPTYLTNFQPENTEADKKLRFILHSPLTLEVYDSDGNRAGPNEDDSKEESITGSQYGRFGETQYVTVPAQGKYRVELRGTGEGNFSLDIQEANIEETVTTTLANLPVTTTTFASFTISESVESVSNMLIDEDGDGSTDIEASFVPGEVSSYEQEVRIVSMGGSNPSMKDTGLYFLTPDEEPIVNTNILKAAHTVVIEKEVEPTLQTAEETIPETKSEEAIQKTLLDRLKELYSYLVEWIRSFLKLFIPNI